MSVRNKFYEVQEQWNNLHWNSLRYFRKEADAKEYVSVYESRGHRYPARVVEHEFSNIKDFKSE